jgi:hypothetical protein
LSARARQAARHRVHVAVRYSTAADFVREYAENLSRGGLFVQGARGLTRHRDLEVELELPGFGSFRVRAEVVHVIDAAAAAELGRTPGAGLAIVATPPGFDAALATYLDRLERRADARVLCDDREAARLLAAAGYRVAPLEPAATSAAASRDAPDAPVIALVAPSGLCRRLRARARGRAVVAMDRPDELDRVLAELDARL